MFYSFDAIGDRTVFLMPFQIIHYKCIETTDFCMLIWYHSFASFNCFSVDYLKFFCTQDHVICKQKQFYLFPSNLYAFYFFPFNCSPPLPQNGSPELVVQCYTEVLRVYMFILFLILGKPFSFSLLSMIILTGFLHRHTLSG